MEVSFLPLELTSLEALDSSLRNLEDSMPKLDNKVYLHHGPNSIAIKGERHTSTANGVIKPEKTLVDLIREEWRPFEGPYPAHPLLQSGHLQTLYAGASNFNDVDRVYYARKLLGMNDGGTVGLDVVLESEAQYKRGLEVDESIRQRKDYVKNLPPRIRYMRGDEEAEMLSGDDDRPMLISMHGLSGGSHESYLRAVLHHVTKKPSRWAACSLNARGCGRTAITTQQLFCANWTGISQSSGC
jgi:predicted alpha/beta-fold hydrolase